MYCPNCGTEIHLEGSYCAKCQKSTAYLTQKKLVNFITPTSSPNAMSAAAADSDLPGAAEEILNADVAAPEPADLASDACVNKALTPNTAEPTTVMPASPKDDGFYCNYCGTFVYEEDNYCYDCGKETRKQYYKSSPIKKRKKMMFSIATTTVLLLIIVISFLLYR